MNKCFSYLIRNIIIFCFIIGFYFMFFPPLEWNEEDIHNINVVDHKILEISSIKEFLDISSDQNIRRQISLQQGNTTKKRYIFKNFISLKHCNEIIDYVNDNEKFFLHDDVSSKALSISGLSILHRSNSLRNPFNIGFNNHHYNASSTYSFGDKSNSALYLIFLIRIKMFKMVKMLFHEHISQHKLGVNPNIFIESSNINIKSPIIEGKRDYPFINQKSYSHGVHADNCNLIYPINRHGSMQCPFFKTFARHYTAVLYLKPSEEGGNFVFIDGNTQDDVKEQIVPIQPGKLVIFTSGYENKHGVESIINGTRYSMAMWISRFSNSSESSSMKLLLYGSKYRQILDENSF